MTIMQTLRTSVEKAEAEGYSLDQILQAVKDIVEDNWFDPKKADEGVAKPTKKG